MWVDHTTECNLVFQRSTALTHTISNIGAKDMVLRSQLPSDRLLSSLFYDMSNNAQTLGNTKSAIVSGDSNEGDGKLLPISSPSTLKALLSPCNYI